jgi:hypothetical protein
MNTFLLASICKVYTEVWKYDNRGIYGGSGGGKREREDCSWLWVTLSRESATAMKCISSHQSYFTTDGQSVRPSVRLGVESLSGPIVRTVAVFFSMGRPPCREDGVCLVTCNRLQSLSVSSDIYICTFWFAFLFTFFKYFIYRMFMYTSWCLSGLYTDGAILRESERHKYVTERLVPTLDFSEPWQFSRYSTGLRAGRSGL